MTTVACVWVRANVPYGVEYVANLRAMVERHLSRPFRFVCLTDRPEQLPVDVEGLRIAHDPTVPGWWAKMELFAPDRLTGRVLYLDLDSLVCADLDPIVDVPAPFALLPDGGTFKPRTHHRVVKRFNSSVMVWDAGVNGGLYDTFAEARDVYTREFWGDQDFIGQTRPEAATFPAQWFPRLSELDGAPPPPHAKVVLCKKPKNAIAARQFAWVADVWRAA